MNILTVFTGGTIGSAVTAASSHSTISLDEKAPNRLLAEYDRRYCDCGFTSAYPLSTLSENMSFEKWGTLLKYLKTEDLSHFDGVIILHGTDTLSYTSAFLGLTLADAPVPIVITGSNHPLGDADSNALDNFRAAVLLIKSGASGVFAAYKSRSNAEYYHACDLQEADGLTDCFSGKPCGYCDGEKAVITDRRPPFSPPHTEVFALKKSVMLIKPYPNMSYKGICADGAAAVLHLLYHSATACTEGGALSLCRFAEKCAAEGVPVYAASFKRSAVPYSTTAELLEAGIIPLYEMSAEAAYALLAVAFNQHDMTAAEFIEAVCKAR